MKKITPYLWFDGKAGEAMDFYVSVFKNARVLERHAGPDGTVMSVVFELNGQEFMALNAGPQFTFTEAISFFVQCESQDEVDDLWTKLTADGGEESMCGWLKDKYGLSWQIIPPGLGEMLQDEDASRSGRVMQALLGMKKLDLAALKRAYDQP